MGHHHHDGADDHEHDDFDSVVIDLPEIADPEALQDACAAIGQPLTLRRHAGYDHGYYFIQTVIEDHLRHHAAGLA